MKHFRFSLTTLMGVVLVVATGCAALRFPSPLATSAAFTLVLSILLLAVAGALLGRREIRIFWCGFAVLGWGYFMSAFDLWLLHGTSSYLVTTQLLAKLEAALDLYPLAVGDKIQVQWGSRYWEATLLSILNNQYLIHYDGYSSASVEWVPRNRIKPGDPTLFLRTGHSLAAVFFALLGGSVAQWLFAPSNAGQERGGAQGGHTGAPADPTGQSAP